MISPRWDLQPCDDPASERLAAALGIAPIVARLLCQRGLGDPETAQRFLNPSLDHLHDPLMLADMRVAVDRIMAAIERKERIAIHGDYDVDGITSTVILRRALEMLGADVVHFIPERLKDGYGLQPVAIERLHADGVALVVSVDCGIRGAEAARRARELGVDLIITDHHEPDAELPPALAVINPKRRDCSYPDKYLAGVGVALKLVQALCHRADRDGWMPGFIKVAAIGTLADVVPLVGENLKRQEEEADILAAAKKIVQTDPDIGARSVLVVAGDGWHRGVIGIVASKLVDAFYRPAIVLSVEDGVAHGSCRSISKFDMLGALERCAQLLSRFGGHKQAAGLTLDASRIKALRLAV